MPDPFERVPIGTTSLSVTRLGFGAAEMGGLYEEVDEEVATAAASAAWDLGVRYFDVAPFYGLGLAERRLGRCLQPHDRDEYVLSTKVGRLVRPGPGGSTRALFDFSADAVRRSLDESLERLGLDRVDIVFIHDPDDHWQVALDEAYPALESLRREGTVRAIGAGMNQGQMLRRFALETDMDVFLLAGRYTLLDQSAHPDLLETCVARHISVIVGGVMNSGVLARRGPGATFDYRPADRAWVERAGRIADICEAHGVPIKAAAVQFPLAHPAVSGLLSGTANPAHIAEFPELMRRRIPPALWDDLRAAGLLPPAST